MIPDNLHIGPLHLHIFGIMLAIAFFAAGTVTQSEFARRGYGQDFGWTVLFWSVVGGLLGARFWSLVTSWSDFLHDPIRLAFSAGGLVWYGGLGGGALAATILFRRAHVPWLRGADGCAPAIAIGHAIGRIGCQLSGDGDWGTVTTLPWGMAYPYAVVGWNEPPGVKVHPTPLYECAAYLAIFLLLWRRRHRPAPEGSAFALYLVLAGIARFLVEFVRTNPRETLGMSHAQLVSVALVIIGSVLLWRNRGRVSTEPPVA